MGDLTDFQRAILSAVGRGHGSFTVADIAFLVGRQPDAVNNRMHSARISRECMALERAGLLHRLDDLKPIAWHTSGTGGNDGR